MSFTVEWDHPAEAVLLRHIPWPTSGEVAMSVHRYAREVAPHRPTGVRRVVVSGYALGLRIDTRRRTVLVLYAYRVS